MSTRETFDAAVVGAGILGLAHAYHLACRGRRVVVLERSPRAQGASVRNFGMIWPIGQPPGDRLRLALRSREIWQSVLSEAGLWSDPTGSLHLAYHDDEAAVLSEFAERAGSSGYHVELLEPGQVAGLAHRVRGNQLRCGLLSTTELCVDPRAAIAGIADWLARRHGVQFRFDCQAIGYRSGVVDTSSGPVAADRLVVCSGRDLQTLYPAALGRAGLSLCKLQMMRAVFPGVSERIGPMLAAGLTLRHYPAFRDCPSLRAMNARMDRELPEYGALGIHVLVSQNRQGELTLGDSHEFDAQIEPFDKARIDDIVWRYLDTVLDTAGLAVTQRWHGLYVKHPTEPYVVLHPAPNVVAVTGVGGAGMTLSFGLAEHVVGAFDRAPAV